MSRVCGGMCGLGLPLGGRECESSMGCSSAGPFRLLSCDLLYPTSLAPKPTASISPSTSGLCLSQLVTTSS